MGELGKVMLSKVSYMILLIRNMQNRQICRDKKVMAYGLWGVSGMGAVIAKVCSVSLCCGKNVKSRLVMITHIIEYTKTH